MLLLVLAVAQAQDEPKAAADGDAAGGDAAGGDAAAAEGKSGEDGDEEAWAYVEFLKADVK